MFFQRRLVPWHRLVNPISYLNTNNSFIPPFFYIGHCSKFICGRLISYHIPCNLPCLSTLGLHSTGHTAHSTGAHPVSHLYFLIQLAFVVLKSTMQLASYVYFSHSFSQQVNIQCIHLVSQLIAISDSH